MFDFHKMLPTGKSWRELWLPELINGTGVPSLVSGGHALTLTGSSKRTSTNGAYFTGAATSNIVVAAAANLNSQAKLWVSFRFKLDQTFAAGAAADQFLWTKRLDANNYLDCWLESVDGKLYFRQGNGVGGAQFTLTSTTVSWTGGTWYHVIVSLSDVGPAQRMLVNNVAEDTDLQAALATPAGGDLVLGSSSDGGADGIIGAIADVIVGTDALTANEEADLFRGYPMADSINFWPLDEGRGTTANDRGSGGNSGTLDSAIIWNFDARKLPTLSLDGINDRGQSSAGINLGGDISVVAVIKHKIAASAAINSEEPYLLDIHNGTVNNRIRAFFRQAAAQYSFDVVGGGTQIRVDSTKLPTMDEYVIWVVSATVGGNNVVYANGASTGSTAGVTTRPTLSYTAYLGCNGGPGGAVSTWGPQKNILFGIVDGALSALEAKNLSKLLNQHFGLGISI